MEYVKLRDNVNNLCESITNELAKFKKSNEQRKRAIANQTLSLIEGAFQKIKLLHSALTDLNKSNDLSNRSYFKDKIFERISYIVTDAQELINPIIVKNTELDTEVVVKNTELVNEGNKMAELTEILRRLTEAQLEPRQNREATQASDLKTATSIITRFDPKNIGNFIESVELALAVVEQGHSENVLKLAKQRITGCVAIESKSYQTIEQLKADVFLYFKPKRSVLEVEGLIGRLLQKDKETVDEYAKRAFSLKTDYELAARAERQAANHELDQVRIAEMEAKVSRAFINGLKDFTLRYVMERPKTMCEALTAALEAESISTIRFQNKKLEEKSKDSSQKFPKSEGNYKKPQGQPAGSVKGRIKFETKKDREKVKCYECEQLGHYKSECPKLVGESSNSQGEQKARDGKKEGAVPKNGDARGASVSAKTLKAKKPR